MIDASPSAVKPHRPPKRRANADTKDPVALLIREAQRMQDRRRYLRDGFRSAGPVLGLHHPKGVDPPKAVSEIAFIEGRAARALAVVRDDP